MKPAPKPARPPLWPFPPVPLHYPSLPPDARPVRAPRPPLPAEPAPF
jgi:hypothetical protein